MNEGKMGFFPLFWDIRKKRVLVVGGGEIATRRIRTLCGFETSIELVSPDVTEELRGYAEDGAVTWHRAVFDWKFLEAADLVLACTNDTALNHRIVLLCRERGIPVNNCSCRGDCDFYFPAIVRKGDVVAGITASGTSHSLVREVRERIEDALGAEQGPGCGEEEVSYYE